MPRVASNNVVYVEHYGARTATLEELNTLRSRREPFDVLSQSHGMSKMSRDVCSDRLKTTSIPCIKLGFDTEDLDVVAVASLIGDAYAESGDVCFVVEVTNGVPRARML